MKKLLAVLMVAGMVACFATGCSGVRQSQGTYVAHATSFHLFGLKIPGDSLEMAEAQVPASAKSKQTIMAAPSDWTSVTGVLNNIIGFNCAAIGGEL